VNGDNNECGFVAALNRTTGELAWRMDRATYHEGSYGTPVVANLAGRPQLLLTGLGRTTSYDPATGRVLWTCRGPAAQTANSVVLADPYVFACGGVIRRMFLCVRADGEGDVTNTNVVWQIARAIPNVPSPLFYNSRIYAITDAGILTCRDAMAGEVLWRKQLREAVFASPVAVAGHVYFSTESGKTFVFRDAPQMTLVSENRLDGSIYASPAICQGQLLIRSDESLYCIGH
jgi:outer membrane protein assembly factor BamB